LLNVHSRIESAKAVAFLQPSNVGWPSQLGMAEICRRTWKGLTASVMEFEGPDSCLRDFGSEHTRLLVMLDEVGGHAELRSNPERPAMYGYRGADHVSLMPEGFRAWEHTNGARRLRQVLITFLPFEVDEDTQRRSEVLSPRLMFSDKRIWKLAALLAAEAENEFPLDPLYGESVGAAIFAGLTSSGRGEDNSRGGLPPRQLKRITDYISGNASGCVHVDELASLVGLSPSHFSRAFKISTGVPPYRWLLNVRAREAQKLLLDSDMPLAEIALETGFCEQGHFTRAFRAATGTTPAAWRKVHRS